MGILLFSESIQAQKDSAYVLRSFELIESIEPEPVFTERTYTDTILRLQPQYRLDDFLKYQTPLQIKDYGNGALSTISFRGYGSRHTKVFWENVPLNSGMNGSWDAALFPLFFTDAVSLQFGGAGMINGNGGLGGTVVLTSSPDWDTLSSVRFFQQISSLKNTATGLRFKLARSRLTSETGVYYQREQNEFEYKNPGKEGIPIEQMRGATSWQLNAMEKLSFRFKGNGRLSWSTLLQQSERNLPHLTTQSTVSEVQRDASLVSALSYNKTFKYSSFLLSAGGTLKELNYDNQAIGIDDISAERTVYLQARYNYWLFKKIKAQSAVLGNLAFAHHPKYGKEFKRQQDIQLINRFSYSIHKRLMAHLLVKSQWIDTHSFPVLPSFGLRWEIDKRWLWVKSNVNYHVAVPTLNDLYWGEGGNPNLVPERGWNTELNLSSSNAMGWNYLVSLYTGQTDDRILWSPNDFGIWTVTNVESVQNYGLESFISYRKSFFQHFVFTGKVQYQRNHAIQKEGYQLIYVPVNSVNTIVRLQQKRWVLQYAHYGNGKRYIDARNQAYMPHYYNSNVSIERSVALKKDWELGLNFRITNLFNEPYQELPNRPLPGRVYQFSVKANLR